MLDFSECSSAPLTLLRADGRVRAEPLPARVALPPRAGRRVPGHEPRAVGARGAARPGLGRGARPRHDAPAAVASSSSATASSRSTASATPTWRCSTRRRRHIDALRPGGDARGVDQPQLPRRAGLLAFVNDAVRRDRGGSRARGRRVPLRRARTGSRSTRRRDSVREPALGLVGGRDAAASCAAARRRRDRPRARARRRCATGRPGVPRAAASGRHRDPLPLARRATASSSARSRRAASRPTSTRGSASSRPTRSRTWSRCCASSPTRRRDLRAAAFLRSRFVAALGRRRCGAGAGARGALVAGDAPPAAFGRLDEEDRACSRALRAAVAALAVAASIACRRRTLLEPRPARDRLRVRAARRAAAAGAREPEEDARPRPPDPEPRLRDAGRDRRRTSMRSRPATSRTPCIDARRRREPDDGARRRRDSSSRSCSS